MKKLYKFKLFSKKITLTDDDLIGVVVLIISVAALVICIMILLKGE